MKKLSKNEINVLTNVILEKVKEVKNKTYEKLLSKDKMYLKWKKLNGERKILNDKVQELNKEINNIQGEISGKYKIYIGYDGLNNVMISSNNNNDWNKINKINNEIVLMGIGNNFNVDELIDKLVDKYSKEVI